MSQGNLPYRLPYYCTMYNILLFKNIYLTIVKCSQCAFRWVFQPASLHMHWACICLCVPSVSCMGTKFRRGCNKCMSKLLASGPIHLRTPFCDWVVTIEVIMCTNMTYNHIIAHAMIKLVPRCTIIHCRAFIAKVIVWCKVYLHNGWLWMTRINSCYAVTLFLHLFA